MTAVRILVVDDDAAIRSLLRLVASRAGFEVHVAADGKQAMALITSERYDVMLLDLMMPVMSGYEVLAQLDGIPSAPPVIIVSAMVESRPSALDSARVQGILHKPFDVERVVQLLTDVVQAMPRDEEVSAEIIAPPPGPPQAVC
ncbi:MAG TPA: response regulator [Thermoanaerobaculia bacterium]